MNRSDLHGPDAHTERPAHRTLLDALAARRRDGDGRGYTFLPSGGGAERYLGFRALVDEAEAYGRRLAALGLKKGDRVALVIPESDEFVLTFLGACTQGILPVPLYPPLSLGRLDAYVDSTARILEASAADVLVTTTRVQKVLWSVMDRVKTLRDLVTIEKLCAGPAPSADSLPAVEIAPSDPVFLQFTSGSTAAPKGVVVTHASLSANSQAILDEGLDVRPTDVAVSWLPLYHDMGLIGFVLAPLYRSVQSVFIPTLDFVRRPTLWMEAIHRHRGSMTFAPNFAFARVAKRATDADLARWDLSCLRAVGCGAEPIHPDTMRLFTERFAPVGLRPEALLPSYGMAEATLAMTFAGLDERVRVDVIDADACHERDVAEPVDPAAGEAEDAAGAGVLGLVSCGRPFSGHEVGIFDEGGARLPERRIGEIRFRGPSVAAGYFRNPEATAAAFEPAEQGGWLHTGDLGYLADGELFITGRRKDILILNGRNYYPQGIEWQTEEVPGIRRGNVVAFSVPGESSEEAVIVAETGEQDEARRREIIQAVRTRINAEMGLAVADVHLLGVGEMPKTTSGKLQRRRTREQFLAGTLGGEGVRIAGSAAERLTLARHLAKSLVSRVRHRATSVLGLKRGGGAGPDSTGSEVE